MKDIKPFYHYIFQTKFGYAAFVFHKQPFLLNRVLLPSSDFLNVKKRVVQDFNGTEDLHPVALKIADTIIEYFNGRPVQVCWEHLDIKRFTTLQRAVWTATSDIPFGQVKSYKEIAESIGRPFAYRFVGTTLGRNPFPLLIPCHRVIKNDGSIGQFTSGTDLKKRLVEFEKKHFLATLSS